MSELPGLAIAVTLFCIGYLPTQWLRSRRAAAIAALGGVALIPLALALIRSYAVSATTTLMVVVFLFWLIPVGYAMLCGAIVRYYTLGRPELAGRDRRGIAAACGAGLFILMIATGRALMSGLD